MNRSIVVQLCAIVIVLLALSTCVAAHPDESTPYDAFDLDMSPSLLENIGQHLIDPQIMVRMSSSYPPTKIGDVDGRIKASWNPQLMSPLLAGWQGADTTPCQPELGPAYDNVDAPTTTADVDGRPFPALDARHAFYPPIPFTMPPVPSIVPTTARYPPYATTQAPPMAEPGPSTFIPVPNQQVSMSLPDRMPFYPSADYINNPVTTGYGPSPLSSQFQPASYPRFIPQGHAMRSLSDVRLTEEMHNHHNSAINDHSAVMGWATQSRTGFERVQPIDSLPTLDVSHLQLPPTTTPHDALPTSPASNGSSRQRAPPRKKEQLKEGDHQHVCRQCQARFPTSGGLSRHHKWHEPYDRRQHACNACQLRFRYPKDLKRHKATHEVTPSKRHFCPISECKYATKGFTRSDHLVRHQRTQHRDLPLTPATTSTPVNHQSNAATI